MNNALHDLLATAAADYRARGDLNTADRFEAFIVGQDAENAALDVRLRAAGMFSVAEVLNGVPIDSFMKHADVSDMATFSQWLEMKRAECLRLHARLELGDRKDDELHESVLAQMGVLAEVHVNFKTAIAGQQYLTQDAPQVVGSLLLGGADGGELGDIDLQLDMPVVEALQAQLVRDADDVAVKVMTVHEHSRRYNNQALQLGAALARVHELEQTLSAARDVSQLVAPEVLAGPATHLTWTPDNTPAEMRRPVVLLDAGAYEAFLADHHQSITVLKADKEDWARRWKSATEYGARLEETRDSLKSRVAELESAMGREQEGKDLAALRAELADGHGHCQMTVWWKNGNSAVDLPINRDQYVQMLRILNADVAGLAAGFQAAVSPVAQAPGEYPAVVQLLRSLVEGEVGRLTCSKLDDGQGTDTTDGRNWLAASEFVRGLPGTLQQPQLPRSVRTWFDAKLAHVNAVNAYNSRLAFVREHMPFGTNVDPEYQIMEAAERCARSLIVPMFEELRGLVVEGEQPGTTPPDNVVRGLAGFAFELIKGALDGGNFDGGEIQESAERHGVLAKQVMTKPCAGPEGNCPCAWSTSFPTECYRINQDVLALIGRESEKSSHD
ncbi:hypothetical protein [Pseudomonas aeruginosa]|uniref:hypothetical protein n=1 Tax=Pseudomonas aeruginosa TaxID=287 RepID=UPI0032B4495C